MNNEAKIYWVNWTKMGTSKWSEGLGFRDLENFNKVLLAKQFWKMLQNIESPCAKILKVKYFPYGGIIDAKLGIRPPYVWGSIWSTMDLLKDGLI